jgi:hypothetical protein
MSGSADQRLSIRLSFEGAQEARAQLEQLGQAGDTAMRRLETGGQAASRSVAAVGQAGDALRAGLGQINGDLATAQRQFESLANSTVQLAGALRGGAGLAGTIGLVVAAATAAYAIYENWGRITASFTSAMDSLTGRYRENSTALDRANELLKEYNLLTETATQKTARLAGEAIFARQAQVALSQEELRGEVTRIQGEIDRRIGLTEGRISAARRGPGGAALSPDSEEILQREIARTRERAESSPEIQRLRAEMARREEVIARLERERQQIAGQYVASQENVGSVLNQPPEATRATREARSARAELNETEREYQRLVQSGISLAGNAATEQQRYAEQVIALDAALGAARITQEQYNRAVAALDPAARAAREAQEQAARQAEQFARRSRDALAQIGENALDRIGTGLVNAFAAGGKAALDFQSLMKGVIASIAADLLKLAIVAPITNAVFGTSRPTLMGAFQPGGVSAGGGGGIGAGQILQAGQAISGMAGGGGGIMSALGLGGAGAGIASFLARPLYTPGVALGTTQSGFYAGTALPGEAGAFAGGGLGATPVTIGGALGSAAAGFGAGMLGGTISGGIRGTADPTAGSAIGAAIGTAIGFALIPVLGPLGPIIGGFVGGTAGGLFGPTRKGMAARAGGDVFLGVNDAGLLNITNAAGKRWDQGGATAAVQQQLDAINQAAAARGLTFAAPGQHAVGFGQASSSPRELQQAAFIAQLRSGNANQMTAFSTLAGRQSSTLEQAFAAADFVTQIYDPLTRAAEQTSAFTAAMEALNKTYDDATEKARDLGLAETDLQAQRAVRIAKLEADRARDLDIIDRTIASRRMIAAGDTRGAGLTQFDLRAEAELRAFGDQLFALGFERTGDEYRRRVVELEQVIADERLAVMRQYDQQVRGLTQGLLESLTLGDLGGLPLEARYGAALASLSAAQQPLLDGATPEELAEFARVAQIALPVAREFLGISGSFAELVADVSRTLRTAAPGTDPANLGALLEAQVAGADRLELAVIGTGQAQTQVLNSLLTELRRLTAQNEALLARATV